MMSSGKQRELLSAGVTFAQAYCPVVMPDVAPSNAPLDWFSDGRWCSSNRLGEWAIWSRDRDREAKNREVWSRRIARRNQWSHRRGKTLRFICAGGLKYLGNGRRRAKCFGNTDARRGLITWRCGNAERVRRVAERAHCSFDLNEPVDAKSAAEMSNLCLMGSNTA